MLSIEKYEYVQNWKKSEYLVFTWYASYYIDFFLFLFFFFLKKGISVLSTINMKFVAWWLEGTGLVKCF